MSEVLVGPFGEEYELSTRFDTSGGSCFTANVHEAESWGRTLDWVVDTPANRRALRSVLMRAIPKLGAEAHSLPEPRLLELLAREVASGEITIGVRAQTRPLLNFEETLSEEVVSIAEEAAESETQQSESETSPAPTPVVECVLDVVTYECSHKAERKAALRLEAGNSGVSRVLEVIAGGKGDGETITVKPEYSANPCANHQPKSLSVSGPGTHETKAHGDGEVELYYDLINKDRLLDFLFSWNLRPASYSLSPQVCTGHGMAATIKVYPALSVKAWFMLKLDTDSRVDRLVDKANDRGRHERRGRPPYTAWLFEVGLNLKYGSHGTEFKYTNQEDDEDKKAKIKKWAGFNRTMKRAIDTFVEKLWRYAGVQIDSTRGGDKIDAVRVRPMFPQLEVEYEGQFKEIETKCTVGTAWTFKFKANPLFGIEVRVEILAVMIKALATTPQTVVIAKGLEKIRGWAKDKGQTFEIYIALQGVIEGECGIEKKPELAKGNATGMIQGALKVLFEASASFGSSGWVKFSFGAEVKGNTGLAVRMQVDHDAKGVFVQGKFVLLECKFEVAAWASGKFVWEIKKSYDREFVWWNEKDLLTTGSKYILSA